VLILSLMDHELTRLMRLSVMILVPIVSFKMTSLERTMNLKRERMMELTMSWMEMTMSLMGMTMSLME